MSKNKLYTLMDSTFIRSLAMNAVIAAAGHGKRTLLTGNDAHAVETINLVLTNVFANAIDVEEHFEGQVAAKNQPIITKTAEEVFQKLEDEIRKDAEEVKEKGKA